MCVFHVQRSWEDSSSGVWILPSSYRVFFIRKRCLLGFMCTENTHTNTHTLNFYDKASPLQSLTSQCWVTSGLLAMEMNVQTHWWTNVGSWHRGLCVSVLSGRFAYCRVLMSVAERSGTEQMTWSSSSVPVNTNYFQTEQVEFRHSVSTSQDFSVV